jgi:large subunit ribosomal protein L25
MMATEAVARAVTNPQAYKQLTQTLPPLLIRFFEKFPPGRPYATESQKPDAPASQTTVSEDGVESIIPPSKEAMLEAATPFTDSTYNPFLPWRNPITQRWRGPYYGLRRQAVLCKTAATHGVAELLPWSMKLPWVKLARREERGLRMKGTGEGDKVKGHKWERQMKGKVQKRKDAMLEMPLMVRQWKEVSYLSPGQRIGIVLINCAERTWKRMEEVAKWACLIILSSTGPQEQVYCMCWPERMHGCENIA